MKKAFFYSVIVLATMAVYGQNDSLQIIELKPVRIHATRIIESQQDLPLAVTKTKVEKDQDIRQQITFQEYLQNIPGLFSLNANNYSQDLRISIRGFGSRSAFGIRGIKLLVDGIPETTPDGQGQIDNLNLGIIKAIEVIRGPSSSLYGNASGGVISIETQDSIHKPFIKTSYTAGSYNLQKLQIGSGFKTEKGQVILQGNYTTTDGYRVQSGFENYNINARMTHQFSNKSKLNLQVNYTNSPVAEDAGGLTLEELTTDRRQARQRNITFKTEETISQFKLGARFKHDLDTHKNIETYGFYSSRDFYGKLPFEFGGVIDLKRSYFGNGTSFNFNTAKHKFQLGYDWAIQNDNRQRFLNLEGLQGDQTLNQDENFTALGLYAMDHIRLNAFLFRLGLRYDFNTLKAKDAFLSNGDDSGRIQLNTFNPSIGLSYKLSNKLSVFTGFSTSFETPTLSELSTNPIVEGGFNNDLKAQKANNVDVGLKFSGKTQSLEAVIFYIKTYNDIVPFEVEAFPDRSFFRNAGSSKRKGLELDYKQRLTRHLMLNAVYTYSSFKYESYTIPAGNFADNYLPGIPKHKGFVSLFYKKDAFVFKLEGNFIGSLFADDANSTEIKEYALINLNSGYDFNLKSTKVTLFLGINNLLDTHCNDNIRINAFGGRYYEATPGINVFGGLRVMLF